MDSLNLRVAKIIKKYSKESLEPSQKKKINVVETIFILKKIVFKNKGKENRIAVTSISKS